MALYDGQRLCVGHIHVHPNSLPPVEERRPPGGAMGSWARSGCLAHVSFGALVTVQFLLPRLSEAFWLLEGLVRGPCHALRKIVDRQSRWRPREQRFESLDDASLQQAAQLADDLSSSCLQGLRHLEGPVFVTLLRAKAARVAVPDSPSSTDRDISSRGSSSSSSSSRRVLRDSGPSGFACTEVLHLVDVAPDDLLGLVDAAYPKLRKLVLLNLPAATPGLTVRAISSFITKAPNLEELQLDFQFFDPSTWDLDALEVFVDKVKAAPSKVTKLGMEWCRLGDAGVHRLCRALSRCPGSITELSLAHCELRDVSSICDLLATPGLALTRLDLSSNNLDDRQAVALAKVLPTSQLVELRLRDSHVSVALPVKTEWWWGC